MKKKIMKLLLAVGVMLGGIAAYAANNNSGSGESYEPTNPPDPSEKYRVTALASPDANRVYGSGGLYAPGETVTVRTEPVQGYVFDAWYEGETRVSEDLSYTFTMPQRNLTLVAYFDFNPNDYDPTNPGDPWLDGYYHRVRVYIEPSADAGSISPSTTFLMREGETRNLSASARANFKFEGWKVDGEYLEPDEFGNIINPIEVKMGNHDLEFTAKFSYSPNSPGDPWPNSYNEDTFEMIVDNFTPGNLSSAVNDLISSSRYTSLGSKDDVHSLIVAGPMSNYDYSVFATLKNCTSIDFSRTTGYTNITSSIFNGLTKLTDVRLPASIASINSNAFSGTGNLARIYCYADVPPKCSSTQFSGFTYNTDGYADGVTVYVPAASLPLYKEADGWKYFYLIPIDSEECSITINLPEDYNDGRYKNMNIILENPGSGQIQRYVVSDRPTYVFSNLIMNTEGLNLKYNLYLKNSQEDILASITDIELNLLNPRPVYTFTDVKGFYSVSLKVLQSDGKDVASSLDIVWKNRNGDHLGSGLRIDNIIEGKQLTASVTLPQEYGIGYEIPEPVSIVAGPDSEGVTLQLVALSKEIAEGYVTDATTEEPIQGAYVTVEQLISGKYKSSATGVTDDKGFYKLEYVNSDKAAGKVTARAEGYITQPRSVESFTDWLEMRNFEMKSIDGKAVVNVALMWKGAGESAEKVYGDYANVDFTVYNKDTNRTLNNISNQYPKLVILDDVTEGNTLIVTATSRTGKFEDAFDTTQIDGSGKGDVKISVVEHGKVATTVQPTADMAASAVLYDSEGHIKSHTLYNEKNMASFSNLKAGNYTLVAMMDSRYFNGVANLRDFDKHGLVAGTDYLVKEIVVTDGNITEVAFNTVPAFDESKFYFTDADATHFSVNKTSVTASNYVTLSTRFNFLDKYKGRIENVKLIYELPEHCIYVENSLINGNEPGNGLYDDTNRTVTVEKVTPGTMIRLCLMPQKSDNYYPSASIEFDYEGQHYTQPLGSVFFQGVDFKVWVPKKTSRDYVWARGIATNWGDVTVFHNGVASAAAKATGNGEWIAQVKFKNPIATLHQIYGEIFDSEKGTFPTESSLVEYDPYFPELDYCRMIHGGFAINFYHPRVKTSVKSYSYNPAYDLYSFSAKFDENADRVESVIFHILCSNGQVFDIEGTYMPSQETWAAAKSFPDSFRIPVNVTVTYTYTKPVPSPDDPSKMVDGYSDFYMDFIAPDVQPIIDPSGYVYEVDETNRLENVTVTVFRRVASEDMAGEITWIPTKWDASEYGQENPLLTDKDGLYGWDVPQGYWQVKYEKAGYETATSAWLPVPPPQLEVNQELVRNVQPFVTEVHAYSGTDGVEIIFDTHMKLSSLLENVYILNNGNKISGKVIIPGKEAPLNEEEQYSSVVRFIPDEPLTAELGDLKLIVYRKAESYAGIEMGDDKTEDITIEKEIKNIAAQAESLTLKSGELQEVIISATPADAAAGKTLYIENASDFIVGVDNLEVVLDEKGQAIVNIEGLIAGQSRLDYSIEGSNVTGSTPVTVTMDLVALRPPVASMPSKSTVYRNKEVTLKSTSSKAKIYYTVDGSDPTVETGFLYEGPIAIEDDVTTIKAISVLEDEISEVATFEYTLKKSTVNLGVATGWTWISHNTDEAIDVADLNAEGISRILSQTQEVMREGNLGFVGNLKELSPTSAYKVHGTAEALVPVTGYAYDPSLTFDVYAGYNWIGYPLDEVKTVDEAFETTDCELGDVVTGREGFSIFDGEKWIGELETMVPGQGYMYKSVSDKEVSYLTSTVSKAAAAFAAPKRIESTWAVDKAKYPSIMPMIINVVKADGSIAKSGEFEVGAFNGSECRGVGRYIDGLIFMSVFGNTGDVITFRLLAPDAEEAIVAAETLTFVEALQGSLSEPFRLSTDASGVSKVKGNSNIRIEVIDNVLYVEGPSVDSILIFDMDGRKLISRSGSVHRSISLDGLNHGVHIVVVENDGEWSYHKIIVK